MRKTVTEEILKGNQLIAEFMPDMELYRPPNFDYQPYWRQFEDGMIRKEIPPIHLNYHTSWDMLMPVVEKINELGDYHFIIYGAVAEVVDVLNFDTITKSSTTDEYPEIIQAVWETAVQFIEWWNEHQKTSDSLKPKMMEEKEIEINGVLSGLADHETEDTIWDKFIHWVEEHGWSFGGKITDITEQSKS